MIYQAGKTANGYLALPESGSGPGVLVLHAWWGLNDVIVELCDRLAKDGYVALAPDMFAGAVATTIEDAQRLAQGADDAAVQAVVLQALDTLQQHPGVRGHKVAALGLSFGAAWAFVLSTVRPEDIAAVVVFYGIYGLDFTPALAAFQGHFAKNDQYESLDDVRAVEADLRAAGREVEFHVYPGAGHWFFEADRPDAYDAGAAHLAWERTVAFLKSTLR
jgi:carboxymethylenebutenolidase